MKDLAIYLHAGNPAGKAAVSKVVENMQQQLMQASIDIAFRNMGLALKAIKLRKCTKYPIEPLQIKARTDKSGDIEYSYMGQPILRLKYESTKVDIYYQESDRLFKWPYRVVWPEGLEP